MKRKKCKMGISGAIKLSQFASASHLHRCAVMLLCLHPSRKTFQLKDCLADERKKKTKQQNKYLLEMFLESFSSFLRNLSAEENSFDGGESSAGGGSRERQMCRKAIDGTSARSRSLSILKDVFPHPRRSVFFYEFNFQLLGILNAAYLGRLKENFICSASLFSFSNWKASLLRLREHVALSPVWRNARVGGFSQSKQIFQSTRAEKAAKISAALCVVPRPWQLSVLNKLCL